MTVKPWLDGALLFFGTCLGAQAWQLRGNISSHVDRPELLTINITNPTNQSLYILTLNNLFQTSKVFQPFTVSEVKGVPISLTWSRATLNSLEEGDDFHDLPSQTSFVREVNLFDHLTTEPYHPHASLDLVIRLPRSFHAFAGQSENDNNTSRPSDAHTDLPLIEIPLQAAPLHLVLPAPPPGTRPELRQTSSNTGVFMNANCQGFQGILLRTSLQVAKYLAQAGVTAAQCPPPNMADPFSYFFYRNRDEGWVTGCMRAILASLDQQGNPVEINCVDQVDGLCAERPTAAMYAQATENVRRDYYHIWVCPGMEDRIRASPPTPCSGVPLAMSVLGGVLLHELSHTTSKQKISDYAYGMRRCHRLKRDPVNGQCSNKPITNADTYQSMAMAAWQMGLGSPPGYSGQPCD